MVSSLYACPGPINLEFQSNLAEGKKSLTNTCYEIHCVHTYQRGQKRIFKKCISERKHLSSGQIPVKRKTVGVFVGHLGKKGIKSALRGMRRGTLSLEYWLCHMLVKLVTNHGCQGTSLLQSYNFRLLQHFH